MFSFRVIRHGGSDDVGLQFGQSVGFLNAVKIRGIKGALHRGVDVVLEVAGSEETFRLAWECARPNAIVTIVALYDKPQLLPLPDMYGKNLIIKTGGVDGCDCAEILNLIEEGKIDTTPLITHRFPLKEIEEAYRIFENKLDGVIKVAIYK